MAEAYQVLARKWRPQLFSELAGLEHIARTLQNAILRERVGHAFLFTGSRGVGKTSAARILAKALNCLRGAAAEPCNQCENCLAVTAGNAADVIEIDGASNRGVGEIRLLRDNVAYLPQSSPYKIYIIDEVHMLTTEAFNALLKTLEEPPRHVKFIMATTDVHKVPMTILSRCQRFDFGRLTAMTIAAALTEIAEREQLVFADGAAALLAREAQGSMRDALSLLDQVRSYAGETISIADLRCALGLIEARHTFTLLEKVVSGDLAAAVSLVSDLEQAGVDLKKFSEEFLFYLRDALFLKLSGELKGLLGISADEIERLEPLVALKALPYWQQLFELWQQHYSRIKASQIPRLALEMALVELGLARDLLPLEELLGRIERQLKVLPPSVSSGSPVAAEPPPAVPPVSAQAVAGPMRDGQNRSRPLSGVVVNKEECRVSPPPTQFQVGDNPAGGRPPTAMPTPAEQVPEKPVPASEAGEKIEPAQWDNFLSRLAGQDAWLGAMLQRSRLQPAADGTLGLEVAPHVLDLLAAEGVKEKILSSWSQFTGRQESRVLQLRAVAAPAAAVAGRPQLTGVSRSRSLPSKEEIFNDPAVRFVSERFGGRVTEIKPRK
ncbi:MAG: DNA polymerase III subunit gamma/tau [Deltaproteobacteria bacterium]|nr:DNA polymerase III subunit gamma/tau [Deltaproteobacteria bacterium]